MHVPAKIGPGNVRRAYLTACQIDIEALKPGNVGLHGDGHGMTVADFESSARASAKHVCAEKAGVGERIYRAVAATREAVGQNTNLGIVLLAAPLCFAAIHGRRIDEVLSALSIEDADWAFRAIALAAPAGLGRVEAHDVHAPARVDLRAAMALVSEKDRIAKQYVSRFADVTQVGYRQLTGALGAGVTLPWAASCVYLRFLTQFPDSHIARKHGADVAVAVQHQAGEVLASLLDWQTCPMQKARPDAQLIAFDAELKARGVNPGTSADLTVATTLVHGLGLVPATDAVL